MSCDTEVTTLNNTIEQIVSPNVVHQNTNEFDGTVEPYAIDVLTNCCRICKRSKEFDSENDLHFLAKHIDVPMEYEVVKSRKDVECSACGMKIRPRNFIKHKRKVHARHSTDSISQNDIHPDQSQPNGIEEPYAIDVPAYNCSLCKFGPMTETRLSIHFEVKHNNAPPEFDVVKCDKRVKCSTCGAEMFTKNFSKHKHKVHGPVQLSGNISQKESPNDVHQQNTTQPLGIEENYTIDVLVKKCKVCQAEYATEKFLRKHFEVKHKDVPVDIVVAKSNKIVRCSACRVHIKTKNVDRHKERCVELRIRPLLININSRKSSQNPNYQACQKTIIVNSNRPLVTETFENDNCAIADSKELRNQSAPLDAIEDIACNAHAMAPRLFKCRICGAKNILEQNVMKHHLVKHPNLNRKFLSRSLNNDFELLDTKKEMLRFQCEICNVEFDRSHRERHMRLVHAHALAISEYEPSTDNRSEETPSGRVQVNTHQQLIAINVYKCLACHAVDIMEPNLVRHHLKKHLQIPIEVDIFEMTGRTMREKCNICQRSLPEGRLNEHKKRSHYNKMRPVVIDPTTDVDVPRSSKVFNRTIVQNTQPVRTELHKCLMCGASVAKDNLQVHRIGHKRKDSKTKNIFKLIGVKNVIKCAACLNFIEPEKFEDHLKQHATMMFVSADRTRILNPAPDVKRKFKRNSVGLQQHTNFLPKYRNIFECRACEMIKGEKKFIVDSDLNGFEIQKHQRVHRNDFIGVNIFRLFMVKVKCNVCDRYMKENVLEKHMKRFHSWNYDMNFVQLYKCGRCDAHGISKRNLGAHNSRTHNVPIGRNDFKVCALKQKIECDCCGKRYMEGRSEKHHLKACLQRAVVINTVWDEQKAIDVFGEVK